MTSNQMFIQPISSQLTIDNQHKHFKRLLPVPALANKQCAREIIVVVKLLVMKMLIDTDR